MKRFLALAMVGGSLWLPLSACSSISEPTDADDPSAEDVTDDGIEDSQEQIDESDEESEEPGEQVPNS